MKTSRLITLICAGLLVLGTAALPRPHQRSTRSANATSVTPMPTRCCRRMPMASATVSVRRTPIASRAAKRSTTSAGLGRIKLKVPLDFFMMTDHSEMMGLAALALDKNSAVYNTEMGKLLRAGDMKAGAKALFLMQEAVGTGVLPEGYTFDTFKDVWKQVIANAEKYNEPGKFTTFIAYEWTSMPHGRQPAPQRDLPRHEGARRCPLPPWTRSSPSTCGPTWRTSARRATTTSPFPTTATSATGACSSWSIPMVRRSTADYAKRRNENEPLHEAMQLKGTSMTHPELLAE